MIDPKSYTSYSALARAVLEWSKKAKKEYGEELYRQLIENDLRGREDFIKHVRKAQIEDILDRADGEINLAEKPSQRLFLALENESFIEAITELLRKVPVTAEQFAALEKRYKSFVFGSKSLMGLEDSIQYTILERAQELIGQAIEGDLTYPDFVEQMEASGGGLIPEHRLKLIYDQNISAAYNSGAWQQQYEQTDEDFELFYSTALDERVRPEHAELHGFVALKSDPIWDEIYPPNGYNCFLEGTRVMGEFTAGLKAWYSGPCFEVFAKRSQSAIASDGGTNRLRITANHPVLTSNGWIPAHRLQKGQRLFGYGGESSDTLEGPLEVNHQNTPPTIEKVFQSLGSNRAAFVSGTSALDLYGDSVFCEGNIEIVGANRKLSFGRMADQIKQFFFIFSALSLYRFKVKSSGALKFFRIASNAPSRGLVSRSDLLRSLFGSHPTPLNSLSFGSPAHWNVSVDEGAKQSGSADPILQRQLLEACSGEVVPYDVIEVREFNFSGHVYDLQSNTGIIVSENIVTSNCRCSVRMALPGDPRSNTSADPSLIDPDFRTSPRSGFTLVLPSADDLDSVMQALEGV